VDPRAVLDDVEKTKFLTPPGLELRPLSRLARSQSLYRLRYPGSLSSVYHSKILYAYICSPLRDVCLARFFVFHFSLFVSMVVQSFGPLPLVSLLIIYTVGRTPWTGDQPVARPLPTHRTT
jgi:hypothetical protein